MSETRKVPAYAVIADRLRTRILSGELRPGERLPSEADLMAQFGFSRSTIREATRILASENLVVTTRGTTGGTFVAVPDMARLSTHLENSVALMTVAETVSVEQLMDVRLLTEVHAAGTAAQRRTPEQLAGMREAIELPEASATYEANQEFHMLILNAAGNPMLELVCAPVFRVLRGRFAHGRAPEDFWTSSQVDHRRIMAAIEQGDSMTAMSEMRRHLDRLSDAYEEMDLLAGR
ncbi:MAG TPA: FCD domain-containing protein [Nocardioides sp.]|uniref:FadR/GntR family transcriptional regulator n=1 Tax=Nocardioides sp. TaxID=35761 RepID=UPI002C6C6201|nr:FCD domain-containing protein [Nocardioides sp.]HTW16766.1 FCD domain-containing protein [Nocardioides sp.]